MTKGYIDFDQNYELLKNFNYITTIYNEYNTYLDSLLYEISISESYGQSIEKYYIEIKRIIGALNSLSVLIRQCLSIIDNRLIRCSFEKKELLQNTKQLRDDFVSLNKKINILMSEYNDILKIKKDETQEEYIKNNTSMIHLVFTNNKKRYRFSGTDGVMFNCQFHNEKTPSFRVRNKNHFFNCFGCGIDSRNFDEDAAVAYLMQYESITEEEALSVLACVYDLDIDVPKNVRIDLVRKYKNSLLSGEYKHLLLLSLDRMNNMIESIDVSEHKEYLQHQLDIIEKISNNTIPVKKIVYENS